MVKKISEVLVPSAFFQRTQNTQIGTTQIVNKTRSILMTKVVHAVSFAVGDFTRRVEFRSRETARIL